jgi:hypothetical protein
MASPTWVLRVLPKKKHTDGPGKPLDYAWEAYLTNARPGSGSMLTAVFYVDAEGSVHEPGADQLFRREMDIDGEGRGLALPQHPIDYLTKQTEAL